MGLFNAFAAAAGSAVTGKKLGGKMDDITVVVGAVVATDAAKEDITAAMNVSAKMQKDADVIHGGATGRGGKDARGR